MARGDADICAKCGRSRKEHHDFKRAVPRGCECVLDDEDWEEGGPVPAPCRHFWATASAGPFLCADCDHYLFCHKRDKRWPQIRRLREAELPRRAGISDSGWPEIRHHSVEQLKELADYIEASPGLDYMKWREHLAEWEQPIPEPDPQAKKAKGKQS